ncbi:hypothetical protein [Chryseobacterium wanjuense]
MDNPDLHPENIIAKNYSDLEQIYIDVNQYYHSNYFTLKGCLKHHEKQENEKLLQNILPVTDCLRKMILFG